MYAAENQSAVEGTLMEIPTSQHVLRWKASEPQRYLIRRPKALQYFHGGELKREHEGERQAGRFELFLDLLYVAMVANFADDLTRQPSGGQLIKYVLIFAAAWRAWSDLKNFMNNYYNDDLLQRVLTLWYMALLVTYGNNATFSDTSISALRTTAGTYLTARLTMVVTYTLYSFASRYHRPQSRVFAALNFAGLSIWSPVFFDSISIQTKVAVAVIALLYELFVYENVLEERLLIALMGQEIVFFFAFGPWIRSLLCLEYSTALDVPHLVERAALFYIIVLGEFLYNTIVGSPTASGLNSNTFRAVETLIIAFCLNWLYTNGDGSLERTHPLTRAVWSAFIWILSQMPLAASLLIGGHMCAIFVAVEDLDSGLRWLWGGGLATGLLFLFVISMCFKSLDPHDKLWLPKTFRIMPRLFAAIIFALLPLAPPERLNATQLLSIGAGLFAFLVVWETITGLEGSAKLFESWSEPLVLSSVDGRPTSIGRDESSAIDTLRIPESLPT